MNKHWYTRDGEPLCDLHSDGEPDLDSNECDSPQNCTVCGKPCNYSLTEVGVAYVMGYIRETLAEGPERWNAVSGGAPGSHYYGSRHVEVVRDWAAELKSYNLAPALAAEVDDFLKQTEAK